MASTHLWPAARGVALAALVAGAVWLATLPVVTCHSTDFLGCLLPTALTVVAVPLAGIATSLVGGRLLRLPWFGLVALSGCAAMYAGAEVLVYTAPALPYWLGFTLGALVWFPVAAAIAQPGVSRSLWIAAAGVLAVALVADLVVLPAIKVAGSQQQQAERFARFGSTVPVPEVQGYHAAVPTLVEGSGSRPDELDMMLLADHGSASIFVRVVRAQVSAGPCALTPSLLPLRPGSPCRVLGPDRWEFHGDTYDVVVIQHRDALVALESPRAEIPSTPAEKATVRDVSPGELARIS